MTLQSGWDETETANVVTMIFGYNENGEPRNSAIPIFLDAMFHGDFRVNRPNSRSNALGNKSLEEYSQPFPNYRIRTAVEIGFNTDGQTIPESEYEVQMEDPSELSPITLEGGPDDPDNPFRTTFDYDGSDDYLDANQKGPHTRQQRIDPINGIDGVRGSIILGANDAYLANFKSDGRALSSLLPGAQPGALTLFFLQITSFYAFVDFVFMADGTKLIRVWDASVYPAHALYVGGIKEDQNTFREGIEWTVNGPIETNAAFNIFAAEGNTPGLTPFDRLGSVGYRSSFRDGYGDHPMLVYTEDGANLLASTVENELPNPLFPGSLFPV